MRVTVKRGLTVHSHVITAYGAVREEEFNGRPVAVKTVHSEKTSRGECQLLASLEDHPNIIKSYGAFEIVT